MFVYVSFISYKLVILHLLYLHTYLATALSNVMLLSVLIVWAAFNFGIFSMTHL